MHEGPWTFFPCTTKKNRHQQVKPKGLAYVALLRFECCNLPTSFQASQTWPDLDGCEAPSHQPCCFQIDGPMDGVLSSMTSCPWCLCVNQGVWVSITYFIFVEVFSSTMCLLIHDATMWGWFAGGSTCSLHCVFNMTLQGMYGFTCICDFSTIYSWRIIHMNVRANHPTFSSAVFFFSTIQMPHTRGVI